MPYNLIVVPEEDKSMVWVSTHPDHAFLFTIENSTPQGFYLRIR